jgi:hypothetical protein
VIVQDAAPVPEYLAMCQYFVDNYDDCMVRYINITLSENEMREFVHLKDANWIYFLNDPQNTKLFSDYEVFMIIQTIQNLNIHAKMIFQINLPLPNQMLKADFGQSSRVNILSIPYLKTTLITGAIFNPGVLCFYQNLMHKLQGYPKVRNVEEMGWCLDYVYGGQQETFILKFSDYFTGKKFAEVVHDLYFSRQKQLNLSTVLLVGIKSFNAASQSGSILINPLHYVIQPNDYAVVIANNIEDALLVEEYEERVSLKYTGTIFKRPVQTKSREYKELIRAMARSKRGVEDYVCRLDEHHYKIWMGQGVVGKITGHIVVYGPSVYLGIICDVIRKRTTKPICYATMDTPDRHFEVQIKRHDNIFFFQCDILDITDLYRLGMKDAYHFIVFGSNGFGDAHRLDDDVTLVVCNIMECYFPNVPMSFELFDEAPLKFLNPKPPRAFWNENRQFYPKFYSGEVFIDSLVDHMVAGLTHYDTNLEVIEALIDQVINNENADQTSLTPEMISRFMTRNEIIASQNGNYLLSDYSKFIQNRIFYTIKIPKCYHYLPWCKLFNDLVL